MSLESPSEAQSPQRGRSRIVIGVVVALVVILTPLAFVLLASDTESASGPVVKTGALAQIRAAVGQTAAAGSYEMETETSSSQPGAPCPSGTPTNCVSVPRTNKFSSRSIVNFEPYAMVSYTRTSNFGDVTLHVNSTRVWQYGGATVGYSPNSPGISISDYSRQVLGTLGPGPGALAMISIASRGGYVALEEASVATARPAGTGTVDGEEVTYFYVTIDITKLADAPDLNDVQRTTIEAALPILKTSGYTGTSERIGVDEQGFVREVIATTKFEDGATTERHSVLRNFGCAPIVTMPNEPPATTPPPPCEKRSSSSTTTPPAGTTPVTTTAPAPSSTTSTVPGATTPSTAPSTISPPKTSVPVQVLNGSGIQGDATMRSNDLKAAGWQVLPVTNAPALRIGNAVQCRAGFDLIRTQLAGIFGRLGSPAEIEEIPSPMPPGYDPAAACYVILGR